MTFYPLEFVGIKPFLGWQGIIPARAPVIAGKITRVMTEHLINIEEELEKLDTHEILNQMKSEMEDLSKEIVNEIMQKQIPFAWTFTPWFIKDSLYRNISEQLPPILYATIEAVKKESVDWIQLDELIVEEFIKDKSKLNQLFMECGEKELKFIENSGFLFGFLLGIIQMLLWLFLQNPWILPIFGVVNGYITNYLALKLIFRPVHPIYFFGIKFQGLFIQRQMEVAKSFSKLIATDILTLNKIFEKILSGDSSKDFFEFLRNHVSAAIDQLSGIGKPVIQFVYGSDKYNEAKKLANDQLMSRLPQSADLVFDYANSNLDIEHSIKHKLENLPPEDFVQLLYPIFEEDEWKLIAVGSVLGGVAGLLQMLLV